MHYILRRDPRAPAHTSVYTIPRDRDRASDFILDRERSKAL